MPDEKKPEVDKATQKDLMRSEGEGFSVMYQSEKEKKVEEVKQKVNKRRQFKQGGAT